MEIVDAHMHFWTPETHPWVAKVKDGGHPAGAFGEYEPVSDSEPFENELYSLHGYDINHCLSELHNRI